MNENRSYRVWEVDGDERPDEVNISATSPEAAATKWMERNWADNDYPESTDLVVEDHETGPRHRYTATAVEDVTFGAAPTPPALINVERAVTGIQALSVGLVNGVAYVNRDSVIATLRKLGRNS